MKPIRIKFWGVRGSIPSPGPKTVYYGGNTPCVQLIFPGKPLFILDAGSGIRELGKSIAASGESVKGYIFISHFHWDHIQGLPFFKPAFAPGNKFVIYGCDEPNLNLNEIISMQMNPTFFPLAIEDMKAKVEFKAVTEQIFEVEGITVETKFLNHPGYALGYRFSYGGKSIVYISDNEPFAEASNGNSKNTKKIQNIAHLFEVYVEDKTDELIKFISNSDLLIHDTQYFPEEYLEKKNWGHSPFDYTVKIATKAGVKNLVLFHHDPDHDDNTINTIVKNSRKILQQQDSDITCEGAREGTMIELN
jgi:phosphoribosyl 1,2-cyclic phosphodiesterase